MQKYLRSKTTWVAVAAVASAVGAYYGGEISLGQALQTALMGLFSFTLRDTIASVGKG